MKVQPLAIPEVLLIEPRVIRDGRGFFLESYNAGVFEEVTGLSLKFVQDNHSHSTRGVLRGLHYQLTPREQGKLLRVVCGEIFDVAVDLRQSSATFGKWVAAYLSGENHNQLWVPPGFAHGFLVLSDVAEVLYKTTGLYAPESERALAWNDQAVGIVWPDLPGGITPILSDKDAVAPGLAAAELFP